MAYKLEIDNDHTSAKDIVMPINKTEALSRYRSNLKKSVQLINIISKMSMDQETKDYLMKNAPTIKKNYQQSLQIGRQTRSQPQSSGGCYIATMAYGDYDHPQVMELRKYRDQVLLKNYFGKLFVKIYYTVSPHLVKKLKNQNNINKLITSLLDKLIEKIN